MGNLELENMGQVPDCVINRLKTSQNVPQERKPENVGFFKNQFPVQFSGGWGRTCIVSISVADRHSGDKGNNRSQYPTATLKCDCFVWQNLEGKCYP